MKLNMLCSVLLLLCFSSSVVADHSEWSWKVISEYQECRDLSKFEPGLLGYWKGRTQMTETQYLLEHDIHNIKADGTGVVNKRGGQDNNMVLGATPTQMWCRKHSNGLNKEVKVQYGPSEIGLMVCIDLQLKNDDNLEVRTNIALFTDPRLKATCLTYAMQSRHDSYTIWVDTISSHKISHQEWTRTTKPLRADWVGEAGPVIVDNPVAADIQVEGGKVEHSATYIPPASGNADQSSESSANTGSDQQTNGLSKWEALMKAIGAMGGLKG